MKWDWANDVKGELMKTDEVERAEAIVNTIKDEST